MTRAPRGHISGWRAHRRAQISSHTDAASSSGEEYTPGTKLAVASDIIVCPNPFSSMMAP